MEFLTLQNKKRADVIQTMKDSFDFQDEPKVGIFWYDKKADELFGVSKIGISKIQFSDKGLKTTKALHKTWWKKQEYKAKAKNQFSSIYLTDYTLVPRGRVFQTKDNVFQVMCGKWMTDHILDLVI